jgi:hypothetical protein
MCHFSAEKKKAHDHFWSWASLLVPAAGFELAT